MPLHTLKLKSGTNRENTRLTNEGGWYESNLIRFRQGTPEKIGGWARISANTFLGVCRSMWNWLTLGGANLLGIGTHLKFYIERFGSYYDVTPFRATTTLTNPFTTISGSPYVTVTDNNFGYQATDYVTFYGASTVGGLTLNGQYQILTVSGATYRILASSNATSSTTNGGTVYAAYYLKSGYEVSTPLSGWGGGVWGNSTWGNAVTSQVPMGRWTQSNWGEDLIYAQVGGPMYYWNATKGYQPTATSITIASPAVATLDFAPTEGLQLIFSTTGALPTGIVPGTTYFAKNVSSVTCNLAATAGGAAINTSGTQSGVQTLLPNGTKIATRIGASYVPLAQLCFLVSDASRFLICFGTNTLLGTALDPMQIRWSDQESLTNWYPDTTNQAGGIRLSHGSKIITATQSRQEILVWTDQALYSMQYLGPPVVWGTQILSDNISIVSSNAVATASGVAYWMGADKFYYYDGRVETLNCDLRSFVYSNINLTQADQFFATTNEGFNEVWWFYCSANSTTIDLYVVYNYLEKVWYFGQLARTAWIDTGLRPTPIAATYIYNLVNQESGVDDNSTGTPVAMYSYITSSQFDIGDGDRYAFIWRMLPDLTFRGSTPNTIPQLTMYLQPLRNSGSGYTTPASIAGANSVGDAVITGIVPPATAVSVDQYTGQVYIRVRGRQMSIKIECNTLGTQWQLGSPRIDIRPDGRK